MRRILGCLVFTPLTLLIALGFLVPASAQAVTILGTFNETNGRAPSAAVKNGTISGATTTPARPGT